jgi:hypothetical protein
MPYQLQQFVRSRIWSLEQTLLAELSKKFEYHTKTVQQRVRRSLETKAEAWLSTHGLAFLQNAIASDPDMPAILRGAIHTSLEKLWPDIQLEIW